MIDRASSPELRPEPKAGFVWSEEAWGPVLRCTPLRLVAPHAFTTSGLDVRLDRSNGARDWTMLARALDVPSDRLIRASQVHGLAVHVLRPSAEAIESGGFEGDGLVTDDSSIALAVVAADCVPILIAHAPTGVVAAAHAGWRGTAAGVARQVVRAGIAEFGIDPSELVAAIGPSVGPCCYAVGHDVRLAYGSASPASESWQRWFTGSSDGSLYLDLWAANRDQLVDAGLAPENIYVAGLCTVTHAGLLHSHRAHGANAGRMAAAIRSSGTPATSRLTTPRPSPCSPADPPRR